MADRVGQQFGSYRLEATDPNLPIVKGVYRPAPSSPQLTRSPGIGLQGYLNSPAHFVHPVSLPLAGARRKI